MITVNKDNRSAVSDFLVTQLKLSYDRVKEVGGYQKGALQWLISFYALYVTGFVYATTRDVEAGAAGPQVIVSRLGAWVPLLPTVTLAIGFMFFILYFKYEVYIRRYKVHTKELEHAFHSFLSNDQNLDAKNWYYYGKRPGCTGFYGEPIREITTIAPLVIAAVLNVSLAVILSASLRLPEEWTRSLLSVGLALHVVAPILILWNEQRLANKHKARSKQGEQDMTDMKNQPKDDDSWLKDHTAIKLVEKRHWNEQFLFWARFTAFAALHSALYVLRASTFMDQSTVSRIGLILAVLWAFVTVAGLLYVRADKHRYHRLCDEYGVKRRMWVLQKVIRPTFMSVLAVFLVLYYWLHAYVELG